MVWVSLFWSCVLQSRAPHYTPSILVLVISWSRELSWEFKTEFNGHQPPRRRCGDCVSIAYLGEFCGSWGILHGEIPGAIDLEHTPSGPNQAVSQSHFLPFLTRALGDRRQAGGSATMYKADAEIWTGEMHLLSLTARRRSSPFFLFFFSCQFWGWLSWSPPRPG